MFKLVLFLVQLVCNWFLFAQRKEGFSMSKLALVGLIVFAAVLESPKVVKKLDIKPEVPTVIEPPMETEVVKPEVSESVPSESTGEVYKQEAEQYKAEVSRLQGLLQEKEGVIKGLEQQLEESNRLVVYKANEPKQAVVQQPRYYSYSNCQGSSCSTRYGQRGMFGGFFRRR